MKTDPLSLLFEAISSHPDVFIVEKPQKQKSRCEQPCRCSTGSDEIINMIDHVIFNNPATVVFWKDGTKTIVKCCKEDTFDEEKGLAMAILKKLHGNTSEFHKIFEKFCPNW